MYALKCIFWYRSNKRIASILKARAYHQPHNPNTMKNTIVFVADGNRPIGGLADRIKGCMDLYDWCRRHNRNFKIYFIDPFLLQNYLEPNKYQWIINKEQISYNPQDAEPRYVISRIEMDRYLRLEKPTPFFNFSMALNTLCTNKQLHFLVHFALENYDWAQRYYELFKPAPGLQEKIDSNKHAIGGKYISISFRFTTLLGDLIDVVNKELPESEKQLLIDRCKNEILKIESENPDVDHVLIASDSITFLEEVKLMPKVYVVPGGINHIGFDKPDEESTMKTFLDFYMIMGAEKSYLVKFGDMYDSKFPYLACKVSRRKLIIRSDN